MTAYAVASLRSVEMGPEIARYLQQIDATLEPFGGRYVIHGGDQTVLEGSWPGDLIMIAFPDRDSARAWYSSPAYQSILPLRRDNSDGDVIIIEGVPEGHRATDILGG